MQVSCRYRFTLAAHYFAARYLLVRLRLSSVIVVFYPKKRYFPLLSQANFFRLTVAILELINMRDQQMRDWF